MFMYSFRGKNLVLVIVAIAVSIVLITGIVKMVKAEFSAPETPSHTTQQMTKQSSQSKNSGKTNEDRIAFIANFGWELDEEPAEVLEVIIPKEFDEIYTKYNALQKKQGYDLEKQAGKRCKRYSYIVLNYPSVENEVRINLLIYKNKIIGGDVSSLEENGFTHGFTLPA